MKCRLSLAAWALIVSAAYLVIAMMAVELAETLVVAFVAMLVVPPAIVETREVLRDE